jgi:hypothetical protein
MRGHRPVAWLGVCALAATIAVGCGSAPAATPVSTRASTEFAIRTPTTSAAAPSATASAAPAEPAETEATPVPTLDPALIGTWEGELGMVRSIPGDWTLARYTIVGPCAVIDEPCGTWEWRGTITEELDWAPWASLGETVACQGQLRYKGMREGGFHFLAATETYEPADSPGCGGQFTGLTARAMDTIRLDVFGGGAAGSKTKGGYGTLHRIDGTPAPSGS